MSRVVEVIGRSRVLQVVLYLLAWTALGLISAMQSLMIYSSRGDAAPFGFLFRFALPTWYAWAILTPAIYWAARKLPLDRERRLRNLGVHLSLNLVVMVLAVFLVDAVRRAFYVPTAQDLGIAFIGSVNTALFAYWIIVATAHAVGYYQERRAAELRAAELSGQLSRARLEALRAQLHPHFLFNTMNAISAFVREQPARAEAMLAELADLLRFSIEESNEPLIPLERELDFVRRYLSIQQTRLGDRLEIDFAVEPDVGRVQVPALILQPLVENAVEHGIAARLGRGRLEVKVGRVNGSLSLEVNNDGPEVGVDDLERDGWRVGLRNTGSRLTDLYGEGRLRLVPRPEGGVAVRVTIPVTETAEDAS